MLSLFRKYQKGIFILVAVVIVLSFSVFGTYGTLRQTPAVESPPLVLGSGKTMRRSDFDRLYLLLSAEGPMELREVTPLTLLNNGILLRDLFSAGLEELLLQNCFDLLKEELSERWQREKAFRPYAHPQASSISCEAVWRKEAPALLHAFHKFQQAKTLEAAFRAKVRLYQEQARFGAHKIEEGLLKLQQAHPWIAADPYLPQRNLSLFGYQHAEDWFGRKFLSLVAELIAMGSDLAEEHGYRVSSQEAWAAAQQAWQEETTKRHLDRDHLPPLEAFLPQLGLTRSHLASTWQRILLFRRLAEEGSGLALYDPLALTAFSSFAEEGVTLTLYEMAPAFALHSYRQLQGFEAYLDAVSAPHDKESSPLLPPPRAEVARVKERAPELVRSRYRIHLSMVTDRDLRPRIPLKETLNWPLEDENWTSLCTRFPLLAKKASAEERSTRLALLQELDPKIRTAINQHAESRILAAHPEWVEEKFSTTLPEERVISLHYGKWKVPLPGIQRIDAFRDALEALKPGEELNWSEGEKYHYHLTLLSKEAEDEILSYPEAVEEGLIHPLTERWLQKEYAHIMESDPQRFKKENGATQTLGEVRNEVAEELLRPLFTALEKTTESYPQENPHHSIGEWAACHRFDRYLHQEMARLQRGEACEEGSHPWPLQEKTLQLCRCEPSWDEGIFALSPGSWGIRQAAEGYSPGIYCILTHSAEPTLSLQQALKGRAELSASALHAYMAPLVKKWSQEQFLSLAFLNPNSEEERS